MRGTRWTLVVLVAGATLVAAGGCTVLMDFDLCQSHDDCHQFEGNFALVCRSGNCVQASCHATSDCPGNREYVCEEQRCVHREDHRHGDAQEGDAEEHDAEDAHDEAHGGGDAHSDAPPDNVRAD